MSTTQWTADLYSRGLGHAEAWRPQLDPITGTLGVGLPLALTGSGLRGQGEGSGGGPQSSSSGVPLVQVRRLDNGQILWLRPGGDSGFSDTSFVSEPLPAFPEGPVLVTVFANGVPSVAQPAVVRGSALFADGFESGTALAWSSATP